MTILPVIANAASWVILLAAAIVTIRLIRGPSTADRAVALDMLSVLVIAFAGLRALVTQQYAYLDVAITLALTSFLATVALSRYIARRGAEVRK
ncbi:MAG: monovalent cation/H+ antiporter complex subunit F [Pseudomonadota bacterium]